MCHEIQNTTPVVNKSAPRQSTCSGHTSFNHQINNNISKHAVMQSQSVGNIGLRVNMESQRYDGSDDIEE